ncbi:hypothetical protein COLSTE_00131 [Collinsella stercoris DSM 13279]|uniref:Uncharacterized protein n=1 Tax=Collinsella stercoris DSM 13279 TaxID=445975 RepID=B6G7U2_9ACTN|nr:hypothetical protein COLSTE_00131 [Collinsella stercoris DSM 13279]
MVVSDLVPYVQLKPTMARAAPPLRFGGRVDGRIRRLRSGTGAILR